MKRATAEAIEQPDEKTLASIDRLVEEFRAEVIEACRLAAKRCRHAEVGARAMIDETGRLTRKSHVETPRKYVLEEPLTPRAR